MKKFLGMCMGLLMMSTAVSAANFEDTEGKNCEFAVDRIAYMGIVNGTGGNKFEPEKAVTRAELSKMVTEIVAKLNGNVDKSFSDVEGHWGKAYISKAASLGILNGYSDGTFKPDNSVSYAEAVAIIMRCMGYTDLEKDVSGIWYENYISKMKEIVHATDSSAYISITEVSDVFRAGGKLTKVEKKEREDIIQLEEVAREMEELVKQENDN